MEYVTRGPCGQEGCRETRYSLDNGLWFCRRGHQQEGRQIEEDPEDFGQLGKVNRVKRVAAEKIKKTYHGRQAYRLFIQAYQLILWKQCHTLVHEKGCPPDLEKVVRDLWGLRLRSLVDKFDESQEEDDTAQLFSSQVPTAADTTAETETDQEMSLTVRKPTDNPRLVETLGLCYLATLLLRLPVSIGDIYRFAVDEEIPFIRAVKSLPREMRDRLPQEYRVALDTPTLLTGDWLHGEVNQLIIMYSHGFQLNFPPLNAPLMLFEYVRQLALPLEIYMMIKKLQILVGFTYNFSLSSKSSLRHLAFPEARLLSLIVVATKLIFPFNSQTCYPTSAAEPAAQVLDWSLWARAQNDSKDIISPDGRLGKGKPILVSESDVFNLTDQQLDDYMDWYDSSWLDKTRPSNPLADMFPTRRVEGSTETGPDMQPDVEEEIDRRLRSVMKGIRPSKVVRRKISTSTELDSDQPGQDDAIPRPGSSYRFYRSESELPDAARAFYDAAARLSGISLHTLVRAVFQTELRLQDWQEDKRRAEYHGEHVEDSERAEESSADEMDMEHQ